MTAWACTERQLAAVELHQSREQTEIDVDVNRDVDILFVIDNSGSMSEEQNSLATNFNRFIDVLKRAEGGLPNVHLGVISTDLGAGPNNIGGCDGNGDDGVLQNQARGDCSPPAGAWISDVALEDGTRAKNYTGELADTFSCIARLGDKGCGFEQPLEAMRRALNGSNGQNAGFLRPQALLAVVIISDEDDCSTEDARMFDSSPEQDRIDSELGFLTSHRCFEFGVQCQPDDPRSPGPRGDCVARADSAFMHDVDEYVDFLRSLKEEPGKVFVAGIIGNNDDIVIELDDGKPTLKEACSSAAGQATPAIRLLALLNAFSSTNTSTTICDEDLSDAITLIANAIKDEVDQACMKGDLRLVDDEPVCTVSAFRNFRRDGEEETLLAKCNPAHSNVPCYYYEFEPDRCGEAGFSLQTERGEASELVGSQIVAKCEAN